MNRFDDLVQKYLDQFHDHGLTDDPFDKDLVKKLLEQFGRELLGQGPEWYNVEGKDSGKKISVTIENGEKWVSNDFGKTWNKENDTNSH